MKTSEPSLLTKWYGTIADVSVTLMLWAYYTVGFIVLFAPLYIGAFFVSKDLARSYQRFNSRFYRWFFALLRLLVPACRWRVDPAAEKIRGAVVVANHISYLDPILLISLYPRHTTIAKQRLFFIPLYGRMLRLSGYLPASADGPLSDLLVDRMEQMPDFLRQGGNLIVFPEGTRSRDGHMSSFNKGAFKIARMCSAPIHVLYMENTDRLFRPGRFLFDTRSANEVRVTHLGCLTPADDRGGSSLVALMDTVRGLFENHSMEAQ